MIYSVNVAQRVSTLADYLANGQAFGAALSSFGWTNLTSHGEIVSSGSGSGYAWTNVVTFPNTAIAAMSSYNFRGAWVSGTTYSGSNTANGTADIVTVSGLTYVHITSSSSSTTSPLSDGINWQPFNYEIWKSNGASSSALPIYLRIVYTCNGNATPTPTWNISIGTGVDSSGNLTGTVTLATANPTYVAPVGNNIGTAGIATTAQLAFSGDADNFRCHFYRGAASGFAMSSTLVIDRAKTQTGADSDAFVYIGSILCINAGVQSRSSVILKSVLSGTPVVCVSLNNGWIGATHNGLTTGLFLFGGNPPFPIFPIVGFVANPLLGCVGVNRPDVADGIILPFWMYGASHNYLTSTVAGAVGANGTLLANSTSGVSPAILYE